jgi:U3 small nucleolar RNA-associated protein 20
MTFISGQLKVNFRPLYADTIEVLSELGKRYPELLWQIAMTEITKCHAGDLEAMISAAKPAWAVENARDHDRQESTSEKQRDFICPNANKLYLAADEELVEHVSTADNGEAIQVGQLVQIRSL